jgi:Cu-Zn family superoxide dismutase
MRNILAVTLSLLVVPALVVPAFAKPNNVVIVPIKTGSGEDAGTATFSPSKKGVRIKLDLKNLPVGEHGVHIHAKALCDGPDFKTAGGHFNPENKQHGFQNPMGHHAGDLPNNVTIGEGHLGQATFNVNYLSMDPTAANSILANGGTSIVIHEKADDMKTDPSGNSGNRIACGVISAPTT